MSPPDPAALLEEIRWLAQAGAGDRAAFRLLYARYSRPLFSLAVRLAGDRGEAEEILQDTFLKIWRHAADYDPARSRPFTWAVTILRRTGIDRLRQRRHVPVAEAWTPELTAAAEPAAGENVRHAADARETVARVRDALAEISPARRRALECALFSAMSHAEIARHLEQPVGTVKSWIRRGLLDLRAQLHDSPP